MSDPIYSNAWNPYAQTVTVTAPNGDIYEAIKDANTSCWQISYPEGADRFWGTEQGVHSHINKLIKHGRKVRIAP